MSGYKKAFGGILALILIGAIVLATFVIIKHSSLVQTLLKIKKTLIVDIQLDDKGTEITSLLQTTKNGMSYECMLGAGNAMDQSDRDSIKNSLKNIVGVGGYSVAVKGADPQPIYSESTGQNSNAEAQSISMPLPGGKSGTFEMKTW
jgi:hypothetical protein